MIKYKSKRKQYRLKNTKKTIKKRKQKGGNENIYGFHHICFKNNGQQIFEEQLQKLKDSGLYDASAKIFCSILGQRNNYVLPDKYEIIYENENTDVYERPIINYMYDNSSINEGKYWYIHTKGVRHYQTPSEKPVKDWRNYMEYFIITKWQQCVNDLNNYDVVGVNLQREPKIHYSGNFWWSKSSYIKTNEPEFKNDDATTNIFNWKYYDAELWVCNGKQRPAKFLSYHTSGVQQHYNEEYPPEKYVEPAVLNRSEIILESDKISGGKRKTRKIKKQCSYRKKTRNLINGGNTGSKVITWLINNYICDNLGGSEIMAHSINKYFINKGYIVNVIIYDTICNDKLYEGVNIINKDDTEKVNLAINSSSILFSQNYGYPELAVKKANELNKPVVIFLHTHYPISDKNPEEYRVLIDPSKINIVYNSIWLKNFFNSSLNSIVLNPPVNCADYNTATNNKYVSLLNKYKGEDIVLRIAEKMPDTKFLIIGGNENKIINNITYKPNIKNIKEIYAETDIVLMPSHYETWGMVATEAMCSGIPTIASPSEGIKENLSYAGLFIDRNSIDEWVAMIYKLKNDRTFYNDISNKCKTRVKELHPSIQLENFEKFIDNIIN